ncbi:MgtC/SapB family protein [Paenibacillus sp. GP183]|uniref:MgtC/SapB family protein n=1 Tax=Paenibacillus sp. GP183 TaxID=1882751 RepID=UPI0008964355|nr:MgtC/SapB family protein [Paenibacillus sp. GP183]SEC10069.1 putative Mg2+ transporter-C (MgtC) family protein [Paenibacillus sp. GP183]
MNFEIYIKLTYALFLGLLIGIDRQLKHKQLDINTTIVICVASCLITIISIESVTKFAFLGLNNRDPMRLAAQIVSGVGFLGAGIILRRNNDVISGLTSAAMIWAASGLGIAVGAGFYLEALYVAGLLLLAVNVFPHAIKRLGPVKLRQRDVSVKIVMEANYKLTDLIKTIEGKEQTGIEHNQKVMDIRHLKIKDLDSSFQQVELILAAPEKQFTSEIYYFIKRIDHVVSVEVEHL